MLPAWEDINSSFKVMPKYQRKGAPCLRADCPNPAAQGERRTGKAGPEYILFLPQIVPLPKH